jgi:monoamine oxidase
MFDPPLPELKVLALQTLQFGTIAKVFIKFRTKIWDGGVGGVGQDGSRNENGASAARIPVRAVACADSFLPDISFHSHNGHHIAIGFAAGASAHAIAGLSDDMILQRTMAQLDDMFPPERASDAFLAIKVFDWSKQPHIRCGYSHPSPLVRCPDAREQLAASCVSGRLSFCGEATNTRVDVTVSGAMETGKIAAIGLLELGIL